jgi:RimJ/RimL family protein N-acetyltransferase
MAFPNQATVQQAKANDLKRKYNLTKSEKVSETKIIDMEKISLRLAIEKDSSLVVAFDYALDKEQHIKLKREEKITKAISDKECFIVLADNIVIGFVLFDYRFFGNGWIELIIIDEKYRGKGIGGQIFDLVSKQCKADTLFTSTNSSNLPMQRALTKAGFIFAGKLDGLDEGDPEFFYYKKIKSRNMTINASTQSAV